MRNRPYSATDGDLDIANPPLELLTAEQAETRRKNQPQIIQRVKGAKYILEIERYDNRPISFEEIERTREIFKRWWESDAPLLIVHRPARVGVVILPEEAD